MDLTSCKQVTVVSGDRSLTLTTEDLLLFDDPISTETQSEETK
jgi:hypothetical protein